MKIQPLAVARLSSRALYSATRAEIAACSAAGSTSGASFAQLISVSVGANAIVRFDPATERWTRFPGSGENSNVRQILGAPGWVYLPESGLDRIMVVRTAGES